MIPAYKEEVKITVIEKSENTSLEEQVGQLREQVRQLRETVEYMNREKSRLHGELESLKAQIYKSR